MAAEIRLKGYLPPQKVIIIGAGVTGLAIGWRLAQQGIETLIFDKGKAGQGASHAAAGMLAACVEAEPGEENLVTLTRKSQQLWPDFAQELFKDTGLDVLLRKEGTLVLALTYDDQARLKHNLAFQQGLGLPVEWISPTEVRRKEPYIHTSLAGAVWSPEDHQVDNRILSEALLIAARNAGADIFENTAVERIMMDAERINGIELTDGTQHHADLVVLAAGAWSRRIAGLPKSAQPPVRPIKGQMLALQMDPAHPVLSHVIWGPNIYMAPRCDGRLILGATVEEKGFDVQITAGGVLALLEAAWRCVPAIEELPLLDIWVGHRPGSRDDAPIFGKGCHDGLYYATGHHRNGILLCPITAAIAAHEILTGFQDLRAAPFTMARFMD